MLRIFLSSAFLCLLAAGPVFAPAPAAKAATGQSAEQQALTQARQALEQIMSAEMAYEKEELAQDGLKQIKLLLTAQPGHVEALLLRGRLYLALAQARAELGRSKEDYWSYAVEQVTPWNDKAKADFDKLIKLGLKSPLTAEAYFFRASTYEDDEAAATADLSQACKLGYKRACEE